MTAEEIISPEARKLLAYVLYLAAPAGGDQIRRIRKNLRDRYGLSPDEIDRAYDELEALSR